MQSLMKIGNYLIGPGTPCFIIAEAGVNHNGSLEKAFQLVDAAAAAGANAVKFQTFKAEKLVTRTSEKAAYQKETTGSHETQLAMLQRLELSEDTHVRLQDYCSEKDILFLSSPFDETSADFLESLDVPAYKIGSGEITNLPFLAHIAKKGKPIILSTGMAYLAEVEQAIQTIRNTGNLSLAVLHCVSNYPASAQDTNLRAMHTLQNAFGTIIGYSDHTLGIHISIAAAALGAAIIEKHFTLDKTMPGPDHRASADPTELQAMIAAIRDVESALGHGRKEPSPTELEVALVARKSLVTTRKIAAGTRLQTDDLTIKRPGHGIPPSAISYIIGRKVLQDIEEETVLTLDMLD